MRSTWQSTSLRSSVDRPRMPFSRLSLHRMRNWTFIIWGMNFFVVQMLEKYFETYFSVIPKFVRWSFTMVFVMFNWVIFRSVGVNEAFLYFKTMLGGSGIIVDTVSQFYLSQSIRLFFIAAICCGPWKIGIEKLCAQFGCFDILMRIVKDGCLFILFILCVMNIINGSYSPFIYYNF